MSLNRTRSAGLMCSGVTERKAADTSPNYHDSIALLPVRTSCFCHRRSAVCCTLRRQQGCTLSPWQSNPADRGSQAQFSQGKAANSGCWREGGVQQVLAGHLRAQSRAPWHWPCCLPLIWRPRLQGATQVSAAVQHVTAQKQLELFSACLCISMTCAST